MTTNFVDSAVTATASSAQAAFPLTNLTDHKGRSQVWRSTLCASETIVFDFGTAVSPTALIIVGPRNTALGISPVATITIQGNAANSWTSPSYSETVTYNATACMLSRSTGLHSSALRYWRLKIDDPNNPNLYIEIGALFLGTYTEGTRGAVQFPLSSSFVDYSTTVSSEGGQVFSNVKEKTEQFSLSWFGLTYQEKESLTDHWDTVGTTDPWFVVIDPDATFSSSAQVYCRYVRFASPPSWRLSSPNCFEMDMELVEEI